MDENVITTSSSNTTLAGNAKLEISNSCSTSIKEEKVSENDNLSNTSFSSPQVNKISQANNNNVSTTSSKLKVVIDNKIKLENCDSFSELLGSVIMDSCHGVRTSARVIQKMKENSARPTTPPLNEKEIKLKEEKSLQKTPSQTKPNKVVWSNLERNLFFDAINEYGKDFDAIANYINTKLKRKGSTDQCSKTKEQTRTLYYQTFHKLSKYIKFSDDVKKPVQELYALINYGEMRRKLQFVSEKNCMKLRDLIYKGYVIARSKGKNIRLKTPSCKALRRLNQLEDWLEDIKLPAKVEVQLKPANMKSFLHVQSVAQNPYVRTSVPLQKKLINVLKTFQNKWRSKDSKLILEAAKIQQQQHISLGNTKTTPSTTTNQPENSDNNGCNSIDKSVNELLMCLRPTQDSIIHRPLLSITEVLSSFNVCLNSYEERIGVKVRGESLYHDKHHMKRQRTESNCNKNSPETKKIKNEINQNLNSLNIKMEIKSEIGSPSYQSNTSFKDDLKLLSSGDEFDENVIQEDFSEILCDSNDKNEMKFSRQDSNSDIEPAQQQQQTINLSNSIRDQFIVEKPITTIIPDKQISTCINNNNNNEKQQNNNSNKDNSNARVKKSKKKDHQNNQKRDLSNVRPLVNEEIIKKIRKGWTISNANDITIGDLYIVFGFDSKLIFEYYWTDENFEDTPYQMSSSKTNLIINHQSDETIFNTGLVNYNGASTSNNTQEEHEIQLKTINKIHTSPLSDKLKQLLVIANLNERMKKKSCFCGHTCDKFGKIKIENDLVNRSSALLNRNKPFNHHHNSSDIIKSNSVFRQPSLPYRRPVFSIDAYKSKRSGAGILKSQQLYVQRILPVQPGISSRYNILNGNATIKSETQNKQQILNNNKNSLENGNKSHKIEVKVKMNSTVNNPHMPSLNTPEHPFEENYPSNTTITSSFNKKYNSNGNKKEEDKPSPNESIDIITNKNVPLLSPRPIIGDSMPDLSPIMELSLPSPIHVTKYNFVENNGSGGEITQSQNSNISISSLSMTPSVLLRDINSTDSSKWLDENINDYSLSSLLGHLDQINNGRDITSIERTNISSNLSVISESSVDYVTKFAEIAASLQNEEKDL